MKERPIIFSEPMVRAILVGRKTQTRRVVKQVPHWQHCGRDIMEWGLSDCYTDDKGSHWLDIQTHVDDNSHDEIKCPYGERGDRLWVITIKEIPGWEGLYGAGDDGEVYRLRNGKPKRLKASQSGKYRRVSLCKDGGQHMMTVHEAVCRAFYGSPSILKLRTATPEVRHLDGNSLNNTPENLDWGTPSQNWDDRKCAGRGIHEQHHNAKLSMSIAKEMRESGKTAWVLAKEHGVSPKTVRNVLRGLTWVDYNSSPANYPRWASRLTLEITAVRVERLQGISEEDAVKEGVVPFAASRHTPANFRDGFTVLWQSIYGPGSWDANPFVWVLEFKRVEEVK